MSTSKEPLKLYPIGDGSYITNRGFTKEERKRLDRSWYKYNSWGYIMAYFFWKAWHKIFPWFITCVRCSGDGGFRTDLGEGRFMEEDCEYCGSYGKLTIWGAMRAWGKWRWELYKFRRQQN